MASGKALQQEQTTAGHTVCSQEGERHSLRRCSLQALQDLSTMTCFHLHLGGPFHLNNWPILDNLSQQYKRSVFSMTLYSVNATLSSFTVSDTYPFYIVRCFRVVSCKRVDFCIHTSPLRNKLNPWAAITKSSQLRPQLTDLASENLECPVNSEELVTFATCTVSCNLEPSLLVWCSVPSTVSPSQPPTAHVFCWPLFSWQRERPLKRSSPEPPLWLFSVRQSILQPRRALTSLSISSVL